MLVKIKKKRLYWKSWKFVNITLVKENQLNINVWTVMYEALSLYLDRTDSEWKNTMGSCFNADNKYQQKTNISLNLG